MFIRSTPIQDSLATDKGLPPTRVPAFPHLSTTVVEGLRDIEAMDVTRDYARNEKKRVD